MFLTKPASSAHRYMTRLFAYFRRLLTIIQKHVSYILVYYLNDTHLSKKINMDIKNL